MFKKEEKKTFGTLQQEQIETARENGLSEKDIALFLDPAFDFLQMQEIRLALEHGCVRKEVRHMCSPGIDHTRMTRMRRHLEAGYSIRPARTHLRMILAVISAGIACLSFLICGWLAIENRPQLILRTEEVTLKTGEVFEPMDYVLVVRGEDARLVLPAFNDTGTPGDFLAVYRLKTKGTELTRTLHVIVTDSALQIPS